jgi:hypothetical protein
VGYFPTFFARFEAREVRANGVHAGVIWFSNWLVPLVRQVDSAVDAYRGLDGMVLDLRRNSGGVAAMVGGVAGHFTPRPDTLGINQTRTSRLVFVANPRKATSDGRSVTPYAGPVAILIDELSGSASEIFAAGMRSIGRVRIFGATSIGGVLPASWDRLPNGDVLYHAIGEFITPAGNASKAKASCPTNPSPSPAPTCWPDATQSSTRPCAGSPAKRAAAPEPHHEDIISCSDSRAGARARRPGAPSGTELYDRYIEATGGKAAMQKATSRHVWGRFEVPAQGMGGPIEILTAAPMKMLTKIEIPGMGSTTSGLNGETGWVLNPAMGPMLLDGIALDQMKQQADMQAVLDPAKYVKSRETTAKPSTAASPAGW